MADMEVIWSPQRGPQKALIDCPYYETFFGGARGGGKTDSALGKLGIKALLYRNLLNAVFFRRELPNLDDAIERSKEIYGPIGGDYVEHKKTWRMPGGGRIRFRPLERTDDAGKYQGQNLTDVVIEEAGEFPDPAPVMRLHGVLRSAHGVPVQMLLTGNPGGPGHHWLKERYINAGPPMMPITDTFHWQGREFTRSRIYIPSRVTDNRILMTIDPNYVANLHLVGSDQLVRAWLEGDWDAVEGAFFGEFRADKHVYPSSIALPPEWSRIRAMDWGSFRPFAVGWYAVSDGSLPQFPRGALVKYRELYGVKRKEGGGYEPNVGVKLDAETVAELVVDAEREDYVDKAVLDPSAFAESGGPSIGERMNRILSAARKMRDRRHASFFPADNRRVPAAGAQGGWDQLRARLVGEDGRPMIYFADSCKHTIRTIPMLQHDAMRAEDVDSDGEDHAADETRYAVMARPYIRSVVPLVRKPERAIGAGDGKIRVHVPGIQDRIRSTRR